MAKSKSTTRTASRTRRKVEPTSTIRRRAPSTMSYEQARLYRKWAADIVGRMPQGLDEALYVLRCAEELMLHWVVLDDLPLPKGQGGAR